jgi:hypothetical protein
LSGLETVIEARGENGISHDLKPDPVTNGNHKATADESSPEEDPKSKRPSTSSRRRKDSSSKDSSSRPETGYGKHRTGSDERPQEGKTP